MPGRTRGGEWDDLSQDFDLRPELAHLAGDIDHIELDEKAIKKELAFQRRKRKRRGFGFSDRDTP